MAALGLLPAGQATAQTFKMLHYFTYDTGGDDPQGGLAIAGTTVYGTTSEGGSDAAGTLFAIPTDGTSFTLLHTFTNSPDGAGPFAGLILSGATLYGTSEQGGISKNGAVFSIGANGENYTNLYSFTADPYPGTNSDGALPLGSLILSGNTLYGTASEGGRSGRGTIFAINTDGTGFTNLHSFTAVSNNFATGYYSNNDGMFPAAGLTLSGDTLYGTANTGGSEDQGTVFAMNTNGAFFRILHNFTNGIDGAFPHGELALSGGALYGTAIGGGTNNFGTIFAVATNGMYFKALHNFTGADGGQPNAGVIGAGNILYGTTYEGGSGLDGTVFAVATDGSGFTNLHNFSGSDGSHPIASLILSGNTLYGTASQGVYQNNGDVFSILLPAGPPLLAITQLGTNVILTWPTNATGFTLEFAVNLVSPLVWNTNLPAPSVVNTNNAVTTAISGTQQFYRLSQ
jgi:uncharacterized repeat protein (TIGR03803 family)